MAYGFVAGNPAAVNATELLIGSFDQVKAGFIEVKHGKILWRNFLSDESLVTDIDPGAANYVYRPTDIIGTGDFVRGNPANIQQVAQVVGQVTVPILDAAVGATLLDADVRRAQFGFQTSLARDFGAIMRKAQDYHLERTFFFGNAAVAFNGFLNYPGITVIPGSAWTGSDPSPWVASLQNAIQAVWSGTLNVHLPNRILLSPAKYSMLTQAYVVGAGTAGVAVSAMKYLMENNVYTYQTGNLLKIEACRYLTGSGSTGGTNDRAIIYDDEPENHLMPFPMLFSMKQPVPIGLGSKLYAEYVFGSYNKVFPMATIYLDGI